MTPPVAASDRCSVVLGVNRVERVRLSTYGLKSLDIIVEMKSNSMPGKREWIRTTGLRAELLWKGGHQKMLVYVQNIDKQPLMPTNPAKARILLKAGKTKLVSRTPFTIRLTYQTTNSTQPLTLGVDTGSGTPGASVADANGNVYSCSEVTVRNDIAKRMERRRKQAARKEDALPRSSLR